MDELELRATLTTFLAAHDREALVALARDCAELVLPLYEAHHPGDGRLRRALRPQRRTRISKPPGPPPSRPCSSPNDPMRAAALAVYAAASLASSPAGETTDATLLEDAASCVDLAGGAVERALAAASAQERLDFVFHHMEGSPSFDAWLTRRLHVAGEVRG